MKASWKKILLLGLGFFVFEVGSAQSPVLNCPSQCFLNNKFLAALGNVAGQVGDSPLSCVAFSDGSEKKYVCSSESIAKTFPVCQSCHYDCSGSKATQYCPNTMEAGYNTLYDTKCQYFPYKQQLHCQTDFVDEGGSYSMTCEPGEFLEPEGSTGLSCRPSNSVY